MAALPTGLRSVTGLHYVGRLQPTTLAHSKVRSPSS